MSPMCECCWNHRSFTDGPEAYEKALKEHEQAGCVCTKDTLEGRRARAGQWWDEATQRDKRDKRAEPKKEDGT